MPGFTALESMINLAINIQDYNPDILIIHHALNDIIPRLYHEVKRDYSHFRKIFSYKQNEIKKFLTSNSHLFSFLENKLEMRASLASLTMTIVDKRKENPYRPDYLNENSQIFERNLRTIIGISKGANIQPILTTMPYSLDPKKLPRAWSIEHHLKVKGMQEHNRIIKRLAIEYQIPLVDLDAEMTGVEDFFSDHIHCTKMGRMKKAEIISRLGIFSDLIANKEEISPN